MRANQVAQATLRGDRRAQDADTAESRPRRRIMRLIGQGLPVAVCELALFLQAPEVPQLGVVVLVTLPFLLSAILAWRIDVVAGREGLRLHLADPPGQPDAAADAARLAWDYERDRYRRSVERTGYYANQLGALTSVLLAALVLGGRVLAPVLAGGPGGDAAPGLLVAMGVSVTASVATAYLVVLVGSMVRLSSYDISARAFTWAAQSVVLVAGATAGLAAAIGPTQPKTMLLLGIFTGVTGHHALDLFLDKAGDLLGVKKRAAALPSALQSIDTLLPEHVSRLEEEGLVSLPDLAYAPTARLFFCLPYGLQAVCAWQDDALLRTKLGPERAGDLFRCLGIRGAVAFRDLARRELARRQQAAGGPAVSGTAKDGPGTDGEQIRPPGSVAGDREALSRVLRLEKDAPLEPLLEAFVSDPMVERLAAYERAVVLEPAQFDRCMPDPGADAVLQVIRAAASTAVFVPEPDAAQPEAAAAAHAEAGADTPSKVAARTQPQLPAAGGLRRAGWLLASLWVAMKRGRGAAARRHAHAAT